MSASETLLAADSPGLRRNLLQTFDEAAMEFFDLAYAESVRLRGKEEPGVQRTPGASFNPRPARIAQVLFSDHAEREPDALAAGMLIAAHDGFDSLPDPLHTARTITLDAIETLEKLSAPLSLAPLAVALARTLDDLRHLHMKKPSAEERASLCSKAKKLCILEQRIGGAARLRTLIEAAVKRIGS